MSDAQKPLSPYEYGQLLEGLLEQAAGYAWSLLKHRADAEDAVQQAALRGMERSMRYDRVQPFRGWWFTVLRNCCMDILRSRRSHAALDRGECEPMHTVPDDPLEWSRLADCLERLGGEHEAILRLRYFGGLSYEELGHALAIPKGTVMSRLHYARKELSVLMKVPTP